jgi:hypothetical protein
MITESEIEKLFAFCKKHYIHFYEVQTELVDHFANAIDSLRKEQPGLTFEQALDKVYLSFGGYKGMQKIQEEKRRLIAKQQGRLKWKIFFSYFTLPKILFTLFLGAVSWVISEKIPADISVYIIPVMIIAAFVWEISGLRKYYKMIYANRKNLLLFEHNQTVTFTLLFFFSINGLLNKMAAPLSPELFSEGIPFYILFPFYVIIVNSYREYLQKVYCKAVELYPSIFPAR